MRYVLASRRALSGVGERIRLSLHAFSHTIPSPVPLPPSSLILNPSPFILLFLFFLFSSYAETVYVEDFGASSGGYTAIDATSWEWGVPTSGPGGAHSPTACWGTAPGGDYTSNEAGAILSPVIDLSSHAGDIIILQWWEWLLCEQGYDVASVEVTRDGGATWDLVHRLSGDYAKWAWQRVALDPSYATTAFRFRFRFTSDGSGAMPGWYVDDVRIDTLTSRVLLEADFESPTPDPPNLSLSGSWEIGLPSGEVGPDTSRSPVQCLATNLDGFYARSQSAVCSFAIPIEIDTGGPRDIILSWWECVRIDEYGDSLQTHLSFDGGSSWQNVHTFQGDGGRRRWRLQNTILSHEFNVGPQITQYIDVRMVLQSDDAFENAGAYIDDFLAVDAHPNLLNEPPVFVPDLDTVELDCQIWDEEASTPHTFIVNLTCHDPNADPITWSLAAGPHRGTAVIIPSGYNASLEYTPDTDWEGGDELFLQVTDPTGLFDTIRVDISVTLTEDPPGDDPVDDPPVVANPIPDQAMNEDDPPVAIPLADVFSDEDDDDALISKSIVGNTNPALVLPTVDGNALTLTLQPDSSGAAVITVRGTSGGQSVDDAFTLTVNPVNDPPLFSISGDVTVMEDFPGHETVTVTPLPVPPDETGQTVTYSLHPSSVAFVDAAIDPATGQVTVQAIPDGTGTQEFTVIANDGQPENNLADRAFTLTITPVNDPPSFTLSTTEVYVDEDFIGTQAVEVMPDPVPADETVQTVSYSLIPDSVPFAQVGINTVTGKVSITAIADQAGNETFTVRADDHQESNRYYERVFALTVNPVNDPPIADPQTISTEEETPINITLTGSDPESQLLAFTVVDEPLHGILAGAAPALVYSPEPDFTGVDSFTFVVNDGALPSQPATIEIRVGSVDDPVIVANPIADVVVDEDSHPREIDLSGVFSDPDDDDALIVLSVHDNTNPGLVAARIDGKMLTLTIAPDANGSAAITIRAVSGATRAEDAFTISVNPVNDPPVNMVPPDVDGLGHPGEILTAHPGDWTDSKDQQPGTIQFAYQWLRADDANGTNSVPLTGETSPAYVVGAELVDLWVAVRIAATDDGEGLPSSTTTTRNSPWVKIENTAPVIGDGSPQVLVEMDEDGTPRTFDLLLNAVDPDMDAVFWSLAAIPGHGNASIAPANGTCQVEYVPEPDWNGVDAFSVRVSDNFGGRADVEILVNVEAVNDPPTFSLSRTNVIENADFPVPVTIAAIPSPVPTDELTQVVTYSVLPGNVAFANIDIDPVTGLLTISSVPGGHGSIMLTVRASDGQAENGVHSEQLQLVVGAPEPAPSVGVDPLHTKDTSPPLTGWVSSPAAAITVTVDGRSYAALNSGDGTWALPDNTIAPVLDEGVYNVEVVAREPGVETGRDTTWDELYVDLTGPTILEPGELDPGFGDRGVAIVNIGTLDRAKAVAVQPDGRFVVAGTSDGDFLVVRCTPTGHLDPTFGAGGIVLEDVGSLEDEALAVAIRNDGVITCAGRTRGPGNDLDMVLLQLLSDGTPDPRFGDDGLIVLDPSEGWGQLSALSVLPDGTIFAGGTTANGTGSDFALLRLDSEGVPEPLFGNGGLVRFDFGYEDGCTALVMDWEGNLVLAGYSNDGLSPLTAVVRCDWLGNSDPLFGTGGMATTPVAPSGVENMAGTALRPDGRVIVAGARWGATNLWDFALAGLGADGRLDPDFGVGGWTQTDFGSGSDFGHAIILHSDGTVMQGGKTLVGLESRIALSWHNEDGSPDTRFGGGTGQSVLEGLDEAVVCAVALDRAGRYLLVGNVQDSVGTSMFAATAVHSGWQIAGNHGADLGELWTPMSQNHVEARDGGIRKFAVCLSEAVDPTTVDASDVSVTDSMGTPVGTVVACQVPTPNLRIVVELDSPLADGEMYTIEIADSVTDLAGNPLEGTRQLTVVARNGDVNASGNVNSLDLLSVRNQRGQPVSALNAQFDVNQNGNINTIDMLRVRDRASP